METRPTNARVGVVRRLIDPPHVRLRQERFDPEPVLELEVRRSRLAGCRESIQELRSDGRGLNPAELKPDRRPSASPASRSSREQNAAWNAFPARVWRVSSSSPNFSRAKRYSPEVVVAKSAGSSAESATRTPASRSFFRGCVRDVGDGARGEIRARRDAQDRVLAGEPRHEPRIRRGRDAVVDAVRAQRVESIPHRFRPGPLAGVHRRAQPQRAGAEVDAAERRGRHRGLVSAEAEAHDRGQRHLFVEVENPIRGLRAPVAHRVEEDPAKDAVSLERLAEADVDRFEAGGRVEPESCRDLGRHVDLGVAQSVLGERLRHGDRGADVVLGPPEETADLRVEKQELLRVARAAPRRFERRRIREGMPGALREALDLGRRQASFEVQVAIREDAAGRRRGRFGLFGFF